MNDILRIYVAGVFLTALLLGFMNPEKPANDYAGATGIAVFWPVLAMALGFAAIMFVLVAPVMMGQWIARKLP